MQSSSQTMLPMIDPPRPMQRIQGFTADTMDWRMPRPVMGGTWEKYETGDFDGVELPEVEIRASDWSLPNISLNIPPMTTVRGIEAINPNGVYQGIPGQDYSFNQGSVGGGGQGDGDDVWITVTNGGRFAVAHIGPGTQAYVAQANDCSTGMSVVTGISFDEKGHIRWLETKALEDIYLIGEHNGQGPLVSCSCDGWTDPTPL